MWNSTITDSSSSREDAIKKRKFNNTFYSSNPSITLSIISPSLSVFVTWWNALVNSFTIFPISRVYWEARLLACWLSVKSITATLQPDGSLKGQLRWGWQYASVVINSLVSTHWNRYSLKEMDTTLVKYYIIVLLL